MEQSGRRKFIKYSTMASLGATFSGPSLDLMAKSIIKDTSIGVIGMDTSHSVAFSKYINENDNGFKVVAGYTTVSKDIASSYQRVDKFTDELRSMGLQIFDSIDQLIETCDCILLETNDGRLHLEQALKVFESGKPVFIDKPVAAQLEDVRKIYRAADDAGIPIFSSSGTRYLSKAQNVRNGSIGQVVGADTYSPANYEPNHSDLYWYGIHGVELLYTALGSGCQRVRRFTTDKYDTVIGEWENGGIGTFRGILSGKTGYGGQAFGTEGISELGPWEGYEALVETILEYFKTGKMPVPPEETLEIYTFMEAAKVSSENDGAWVAFDSI